MESDGEAAKEAVTFPYAVISNSQAKKNSYDVQTLP